jgi:hypothetical protein
VFQDVERVGADVTQFGVGALARPYPIERALDEAERLFQGIMEASPLDLVIEGGLEYGAVTPVKSWRAQSTGAHTG